ncbi:hypothetical protein ACKI1I_02335 [Streptomyces turgidiscabies]|uniref:Uncharacterized protein n=1 Tax=Streptomyces turgidiscabies (strain Car8) TaxID=698760 RepID=L7FJ23_STRT8|nr:MULTISPECIES: hypothetical protein [Streptomyces]ELP71332.1 hypothetical protein STRTUCAR8_05420 [Streptomyces turgidiscabies Car8]MDX3492265.1 hypothetical protein [Streptomyces turgidiscabies]GAQ69444.1 hypothetical protein T45_01169 [Streptomyces turgidiscabies]
MNEKNEKNVQKQRHRIPLALVALTLCCVAVARFLVTMIFDFSVDNLIDGLVSLVVQTGVTTALVMVVVLLRRRRQRQRGVQG